MNADVADTEPFRDAPAAQAATLFARAALCTLATHRAFNAALCGGAMLGTMLAALARLPALRRIDWRHVHVHAVDDSWDEGAMRELGASPLRRENIRRPRSADIARHVAARRYEQQIASHFSLDAGAVPVFDFMLLEADGQGRVAGFSREQYGAGNVTGLVVAHERGLPRVALGLPVIDAARSIALLTSDATRSPCLDLFNPKGALHVLSPRTARSSGAATPATGRAPRSALPPT